MRFLLPFLSWCPGAVGIVLRQKMYRSFLGSCGRGVLIGRFVELGHPENIHLGDNVVISGRCRLMAGVHEKIQLEDNIFIGIGTLIRSDGGNVQIREGANLGSECRLVAQTPLTIGRDVLLAAFCSIGEDGQSAKQAASTVIGDDVWFGARSKAFSSVSIGSGVIIGAHAEVDCDIAPYSIVVGRPACVIRSRK